MYEKRDKLESFIGFLIVLTIFVLSGNYLDTSQRLTLK
jgi:hypothetical protein